MDPATIALLVQYGMKYGIPAVLAIIELFKVKDPTPEQIAAAFAKAQTPFDQGLIPGVIAPSTKTTP